MEKYDLTEEEIKKNIIQDVYLKKFKNASIKTFWDKVNI